MIDLAVFFWVSAFIGSKVAFGVIAWLVWRDEHKAAWVAWWQAHGVGLPKVEVPAIEPLNREPSLHGGR